jgi:hypothetical protein
MIFAFWAVVIFFGIALVMWGVHHFWKVGTHSDLDSYTSVRLPQNVREEKRNQPRVDINWPVSMETSDGIVVAEVKNISLSGAFICCTKPLPLTDLFRMTMIGPNNEPVAATAEVVWSNVNVPDGKVINRGMGVRFMQMSDRHIQLVRQILREGD